MRRRVVGISFALLLALGVALLHRFSRSAEGPVQSEPEAAMVASAADAASAPGALKPEAEKPTEGDGRAPVVVQSSCGGCTSESAVSVCYKNMLRRQNADGSWGGDEETFEGHLHTKATATSLTLLSLLGAGYTPYSREEFEGRVMGQSIKAALRWLCSQRPVDAFEASLMSLSLSETYGITNSALVRSISEDCRATFESWQRSDATRGDPQAEAWAAEAIASVRLSDLPFDEGASDRATVRLRDSLASGATAEAAAVYVLLSRDKKHESFAELSRSLASNLPDWNRPDFTHWYFGTLALKLIEGPPDAARTGATWNEWSAALKEALVLHQNKDGSWPGESGATGSAVRDAMATLALELYYRYSSVFGGK